MARAGIESFLCKFMSLQYAGIKASLTYETENGQAFVSLKADVGSLPPPPVYHVPARRPPSYWCRQERRKAAKAAAGQGPIQAEQACVDINRIDL